MLDPRHRLQRHVPGDGMVGITDQVERVLARSKRRVIEFDVPDRTRAVRTGATRSARRTAQPEPNAPLLIRLVRYPYALSRGAPVRLPGVDLKSGERAKAVYAELVDRPRGERDWVPSTSPFRMHFFRSPPRPRPDAAAWLGAEAQQAEDPR